jgi:hypothetical protein
MVESASAFSMAELVVKVVVIRVVRVCFLLLPPVFLLLLQSDYSNCCISLRVEREREQACARSFSLWTTFFPVANEQEMVEEGVDDARSVC